MAANDSPSFWQRIRERKLVQWAIAYLAGAWVALQLVAVLGGIFDWPESLQRYLAALLALGLRVALVLGWYHGEQGRQRIGAGEILVLAALLLVAGVGLSLLKDRVAGPGIPADSATVAAPDGPGDFPPRADARSVAVLPFVNMSPDPENAYFSDGITEEIIHALSRQPGLKVAARTSSFFFQDKQLPVTGIARQLGVAYVLEGSVRRAGDRARITAQLIDAREGYHAWSETYDRTLDDSFAVQAEIARAVTASLEAALGRADAPVRTGGLEVDFTARELYYKAIHIYHDPGRFREDHELAFRLLRQAIEVDAGYAMARATLASALSFAATWGYVEPGEVMDEIRHQVERALELSSGLDEAHIARGRMAMLELDWPAVSEAMQRAVTLNPNSPRAHAALSIAATYDGRWDDALYHSRVAAQLDPVGPGPVNNYVEMLNILGDHHRAIRVMEETLTLNPALTDLYGVLVRSYVLAGEHAEALDTATRYTEIASGPPVTLSRAFALAHSGRLEDARALLEGLGSPRAEDLVEWVMALAALGDRERALALSERAVEEIPLRFALYAYLPELDPLRNEPRFRKALADLNIPDPDPPVR